MVKRKKRKLKKNVYRKLALVLVFILLVFGFYEVGKGIKYRGTVEYKLLNKGYEKDAVALFKDKLNSEGLDYLLNEDKIDYAKSIIEEKYFINDKFLDYINFFKENSKKSFKDVVTLVNVGATRPWYQDVEVADTENKYEVLVNKFYKLPENYEAGTIKKFSSTYAYGEVSAEETCYNAFIEMAKAAKKDGITLILTSGYRTNASQTRIYNDMKKTRGEEYADKFAARPAQSEHETGLALDIFTYGGLMSTFKDTETYAWLHENARHFGFIERYKEGEEVYTGYSPEAWHYRYVGVDLAEKVEEEGITYEEYYAYYLNR